MRSNKELENTKQWDEMQKHIEFVYKYNQEFTLKHGRQPACHLRTYGCQQNVSDGEKIKGVLAEMGYTFTDRTQDADLIIYNTCAVRENAEDRVFGNAGALKQLKSKNPDLIIGLCGCMMQQQHIADKIRASFQHVDLVFGTRALRRIPELLHQKLCGKKRVFDLSGEDEIVEGMPIRRDGSIKAWVPVMYGCNNFCTYCVVPFVRGRERSREPDQIIEEVRRLVSDGYREIMLLGQNVNSYGKTLSPPMSFSALLRKLDRIPGEFRIRFMTSHPKDCTRELIDTIAAGYKIARHLHLPVQSGSDRILAAMNRRYTSAEYLSLIDYAREKIPGMTFTSDIIVGFPGETEQDFRQTLELVRRVEYLSLFTFIYSRRVGTKAAEMDDPVSKEEKLRWFQQLLDTQVQIGDRAYESLVGQTVRVLVDSPGKTGDGVLAGRTESNVIVECGAPAEKMGSFQNVRITGALKWALLGKMA